METDAQRQAAREDGGREGRGAAANPGTPRTAGSQLEKAGRILLQSVLKELGPADTLISDSSEL